MSTEDEELERELAAASQRYAGDLVEQYGTGKDRIPPRDLDRIIDKVGRDGGDVTMLEKQLSGYVTTRAVKASKDHVDYSDLEDQFEDLIKKGLEESGLDTPRQDIGAEPEPEPEPFGQRTLVEGEDFRLVQEKYGSGEIDTATYDLEREKRGLEPMRA